jgi:peptidoglycan hydrolase-like protein with peptidoglycan-binding domain
MFNKTLSIGMTSSAVAALQTRLKQLGLYNAGVDGQFGNVTRAAVSAFERSNGLAADGKADPTMRQSLFVATKQAIQKVGTDVLQRGSSGPKVTQLQNQLASLGYYASSIDGDFGPVTQQAVTAFQRDHGLTQDGSLGSVGRLALVQAAKAARPSGPHAGPWQTAPSPAHDYRRVQVDGCTVNVRTKIMLDRAQKFLNDMGVRADIRVVQGSYHPGVSASAGTHDGGGTIDIHSRSYSSADADKMVKALRMAGFAAWRRGVNDSFDPHIHAVAIGDRQMTSSARNQVREYFAGGDGLIGSARDMHLTSTGHNIGHPMPNWVNAFR